MTYSSQTKVVLGPSLLIGAGNGIFATEDIKSGGVVANYRGVWIGSRSLPFRSTSLKDKCISKKRSSCYSVVCNPNRRCELVMDAHPELLQRYGIDSLAHMANDAIDPQATGYSNNCHLKQIVVEDGTRPSESMTVRQLCRHTKIRIIATRDIRKGEEILVSYGLPYWIGRSKSRGMPRYTREWLQVHERMSVLIKYNLGNQWEIEKYIGYSEMVSDSGSNKDVIVTYQVMNETCGEKIKFSLSTKKSIIAPLRRTRVLKSRRA